MKHLLRLNAICLLLILFSINVANGQKNIIVENNEMRLIISNTGYAVSLIHKSTGQECLYYRDSIAIFAVRQTDRLPGQEMLIQTAEPKLLPASKVQRQGDKLFVNFKYLPQTVTIDLNVTDSYISFSINNVETDALQGSDIYIKNQLSSRKIPPLDELFFLRLPVRDRKHFGKWLNVMHDNDVAVNLLATNEFARISSKKRDGYRILEACAVDDVKTLGVGAALITTETKFLLDRIQQIEEDFNLPKGVSSRKNDETKHSYYWAMDIRPENVEKHIKYAKAGGFKLFMICVNSFSVNGHYDWLPHFSNGIDDLKKIVEKINNAGMKAGLHLYPTKAHITDRYVTGTPDHRLSLRKIFTLAEPISDTTRVITVEESPETCTLEDRRRILKLGDELIAYQDYTTERPYQFKGCQRGYLETKSFAREKGFKFGLLNIDTWPIWVIYDQQTNIQYEVAERIKEIYNEAGFSFIYFDGAEDVSPPFWYNVHNAQKIVYDRLQPSPLFAEAALRSHFSWHITSRSTAFDLQHFSPDQLKEFTRFYPMRAARIMKNDFTKVDFGWIANHPPGLNKNDKYGTQPDQIEYSTSRAAGWDTGTSLWTNLSWSDSNSRTDDILKVFNLWEEARKKNIFTDAQKEELRNHFPEHTLFRNEKNELELRAYYEIENIAADEIRAFHFQRDTRNYVVYWHTTDESNISLPLKLSKGDVRLFNNLNEKPQKIRIEDGIKIPAGGRRFLEFSNLTKEQIIEAFQNLKITDK